MATTTPPTESRRLEFERLLRLQLEESYEQYRAAAGQYRRLLNEQSHGTSLDPCAVALARHAESLAVMEYTRVLRVFTDLVVHGKTPAGPCPAGSEDA